MLGGKQWARSKHEENKEEGKKDDFANSVTAEETPSCNKMLAIWMYYFFLS